MFEEYGRQKQLFLFLFPLLFLLSLLWLLVTQVFLADWFLLRTGGLFCFILAIGLYFVSNFRRHPKLILFLLLLFSLTRITPVEISFRNHMGKPRFVPVLLGLPREDDFSLARKGDAIIYGCIISGYEPKWVFVW